MRVALLKPSRKLSRARYALSRIDEAVLIHKIAETSKVEMEYGDSETCCRGSDVAHADGTPMVVFKHHSSRQGRPSQGEANGEVSRAEPICPVHSARWTCGNACCRPRPRASETPEKCSCHRRSLEERLGDWATAGPCRVCSGIVQVRSVGADNLGAHLAEGACCRRAVP